MDFEQIKELIKQDEIKQSIGTKQERTLHQYLKYYFCHDSSYHEIKCNNYIVDIMRDNQIIEIQTAAFNSMRDNLEALLPNYPVTIVYPIIAEKTIHNFDDEGCFINVKKSPKKEHPLKIGKEMYKITSFLKNPNLTFICVLLRVDEYRVPYINRYKKQKMTRINQIPLEIVDVITLKKKEDYQNILPFDNEFTSLEFKKQIKLSPREASSCLLALRKLGVIEIDHKEGKKYIYKKC